MTEGLKLNNGEGYSNSVETVSLGYPEVVGTIPSIRTLPNGEFQRETFRRFPVEIKYPRPLIEAFEKIIGEYSYCFDQVVRIRQGDEGYIYAKDGPGNYVNFGFQIDIRGLPLDFIKESSTYDPSDIAEFLMPQIFEIENSLAMYNLMRGVFSSDEKGYSPISFFGVNFDAALKIWEDFYGKPIVLGTITDGKYRAMLGSEFGTDNPTELAPERIRLLSGFSGFFGPEELQRFVQSGEIGNYILYMRTSYPVPWLKKPQETQISIPLLEDDKGREQIRRQAITFNVDEPREVEFLMQNSGKFDIVYDDQLGFVFIPKIEEIASKMPPHRRLNNGSYLPAIINDTKEALVKMGLFYPVGTYEDLAESEEYRDERGKLKARWLLGESLVNFLQSKGYDPQNPNVRAKPLWLHYGGYGHVRGNPTNNEFRSELKNGIRKRGPYIVQPEIASYLVRNRDDNTIYAAIHRLFFAHDPTKRQFKFIGGLFDALPQDAHEVKEGRIHGNKDAVWGQIVTDDPNSVVSQESLNYIK